MKTSVLRYWVVALGVLSASFSSLVGGDRVEFSSDEKAAAAVLVGQLDADGFTEREAALKLLEDLPGAALPWLEDQVEAAGEGGLELRSRLKSLVRTLKKREAEAGLRDGTPVVIDLKEAAPESVLEALAQAQGASLTSLDAGRIWGKVEPKDFSFAGSYWRAVAAMLEAFPPGEGGREDLGQEYCIVRWNEIDFRAAGTARATAGILQVRHARMALENSGGRDYLVLNLVPSVEPRYQVEEVALMVKGLNFQDGTVLEPEEKVCEWKPDYRGTRYHPSGTFTWIFPLKKGFVVGGKVGIEGVARLKVRRMNWFDVAIPAELNDPVKMNSSVELKILELGEDQLKIQFEGEGSQPACFGDYELRKEAFEVLDQDGVRLEFNVNSTSSGGGNGWRNSYGGKIEGKPARVRAKLPEGAQEVQLKFELEEVPMPGASLVE